MCRRGCGNQWNQNFYSKCWAQTSNSDPRCAAFSSVSKDGSFIRNQNNHNCNKPYFYHMNAFTLFWLNILFYDNIQRFFSINVFQVYTSYNLLRKDSMWGAVTVLETLKCTDTWSMWTSLGFGFCYVLKPGSRRFANLLVILGHVPSNWGQVLSTLETGLGSNLRIIYSSGWYLYKSYFDSARIWWICMSFISSFISYLNGSM